MKYFFLINPNAGKGTADEYIRPRIEKCIREMNVDAEVYIPSSAEDARRFVRKESERGVRVRFYACGGDGTLFQVINGAYGFPNAEVGIIPLGSGNDFSRMLGEKENLLDVPEQIKGKSYTFDLLKWGDKVGISHCSVGVDAKICAKQADFKKLPFMKGETAYMASTLYCFLGNLTNDLTVQIDDEPPVRMKKSIFCLAANAKWYGGGFKSAPYADLCDGKLDFVIVEKKRSKLALFPLIMAYKNGKHLTGEYDDFITFKTGKKMTVHSEKPIAMICDGEAEYATDATFEIVEKAINFIVPDTCAYAKEHKEEAPAEIAAK